MIRPFIKWAGGKTRVLPDLLLHLPKADCLIEPFVGGASVFLATEYRRYVLADINPDLINLYREVTRYPDLVIDAARELFNSKNSPQGYNEVRAAFNKQVGTVKSGGVRYGAEMACIMRAAQFLYLNRHGYNGLCRYSRKTGFNVPFGKYKSVYFPENEIRLFAEKANDTKAIFLARRSSVLYRSSRVAMLSFTAIRLTCLRAKQRTSPNTIPNHSRKTTTAS